MQNGVTYRVAIICLRQMELYKWTRDFPTVCRFYSVVLTVLKLCTYRPKYDLCKYNFTVRVISLWNSLSTHVITAVSVDSFKNRLDKFWANEEAHFDYKANLSGSGFARCF